MIPTNATCRLNSRTLGRLLHSAEPRQEEEGQEEEAEEEEEEEEEEKLERRRITWSTRRVWALSDQDESPQPRPFRFDFRYLPSTSTDSTLAGEVTTNGFAENSCERECMTMGSLAPQKEYKKLVSVKFDPKDDRAHLNEMFWERKPSVL